MFAKSLIITSDSTEKNSGFNRMIRGDLKRIIQEGKKCSKQDSSLCDLVTEIEAILMLYSPVYRSSEADLLDAVKKVHTSNKNKQILLLSFFNEE